MMQPQYHLFTGEIRKNSEGSLCAVFREHVQHPWMARIQNQIPPEVLYPRDKCEDLMRYGEGDHATRLAKFNAGQAHEALLAFDKQQ